MRTNLCNLSYVCMYDAICQSNGVYRRRGSNVKLLHEVRSTLTTLAWYTSVRTRRMDILSPKLMQRDSSTARILKESPASNAPLCASTLQLALLCASKLAVLLGAVVLGCDSGCSNVPFMFSTGDPSISMFNNRKCINVSLTYCDMEGETDTWPHTTKVLSHLDHGVNFDPGSEQNILKAHDLEDGIFENGKISARSMLHAATDALCFMYGYLETAAYCDEKVAYSASTSGSGECSLVQHVRHCDHQWGRDGECPHEGLRCFQMKIILGHLLGCENPACELCNSWCTLERTVDPRLPRCVVLPLYISFIIAWQNRAVTKNRFV